VGSARAGVRLTFEEMLASGNDTTNGGSTYSRGTPVRGRPSIDAPMVPGTERELGGTAGEIAFAPRWMGITPLPRGGRGGQAIGSADRPPVRNRAAAGGGWLPRRPRRRCQVGWALPLMLSRPAPNSVAICRGIAPAP
jgi:hypothetical protein